MKKFLKTAGALSLATALACTSVLSVDTAKTASAANAKTLKLPKKATVAVGAKLTLKVTVKPKKAKIKWSSNKKKIAAVNKKGVVTGKKKGTAKITAKSGKKKAVCTVKVTAAKAGIKSVAVTNPKIVRVTLTKKASLKAANFAVKKKGDAKGAYNTTLKVGSVTKVSNKVYDLVLYTDPAIGEADYWIPDINTIDSGDYVQVTVKKLKGNQTGEALYYQSPYAYNNYAEGKVGQKFERSYGFTQEHTGYASGIKVSGTPAGLTAKIYGSTVVVTGTPTTAAASTMTITGKDELGKKLEQKVLFYIGSDTVMLSYIYAEGRTILANDNNSEYFDIHTVGGSGNYTYSLTNSTNELIRLSEYSNSIQFKAYKENNDESKTYLSAGTYNLAYSVKDDQNHSCNGTLAVTAVNGVMVSGKVVAADNTGIEGASVYASFNDEKHTYYNGGDYYDTGYSFSTYTYYKDDTDRYSTLAPAARPKKAAGDYNMVVYPSQIYNFRASSNSVSAYDKAKTIKAATSVNFKLPIYKVTITSGTDDLTNVRWYDTISDTSYGYGKDLYLKKGTYKLESRDYDYDDEYSLFKYTTAAFTVNGNMTVQATKTPNFTSKGTLQLNTPNTLSNVSSYASNYYAFTPTAAGNYTLTLEGVDEYMAIYLYDASGKQVYNTSSNYEVNHEYDEDGDIISTSYTYTFNMPNLTASTYYLRLYPDYQYSTITATITNQ